MSFNFRGKQTQDALTKDADSKLPDYIQPKGALSLLMRGLLSSAALTFLLFNSFACRVFGRDALSILKDVIDESANNMQNVSVRVCSVDPAALLHVTLAGHSSFSSCRRLIEASPFHRLALPGN